MGQFLYYRSNIKPKPFPSHTRTTSVASLVGRRSLERPPTHYRALSNVAANVAAAAALAAQQEENTRWRHSQHHTTESNFTPLNVDTGDASAAEDEVDEDALARLADSFHSERGTQKKVTWSRSQERNGRGASLGRAHTRPMLSPITRFNSQASIPVSPTLAGHESDYLTRGRSASRPLDESHTAESSAQRRSSRASRKGAGMVFLSVGALFSLGALVDSQRGRREVAIGRVLVPSDRVFGNPPAKVVVPSESVEGVSIGEQPKVTRDSNLSFDDLRFTGDISPLDHPEHEDPPTEYIIGRISAWICTTLYLTSRLPQIWKNVRFILGPL